MCTPLEECGLGTLFEELRSQASLKVAGQQFPARLALARHSFNWPDFDAPMLSAAGSALLGEMPRSDIYRAAEVQAKCSLEDLLDSAPEYISEVLTLPAPASAQADAIWAKTEIEIQAGLMSEPMTKVEVDGIWSEGKWRPAVRFAIEQRDHTWRVIHNGKTGKQNAATSAVERIHTTSSQACDRAPVSDDMRKAFRQLPIQDNRLRFCIIAVWVPAARAWRFCQLWGMPFGFKGAVLDFNRISGALVAICRRWLGAPTLDFYDDFKHSELKASVPSAYKGFQSLLAWLGYVLDPLKSKPPSTCTPYLERSLPNQAEWTRSGQTLVPSLGRGGAWRQEHSQVCAESSSMWRATCHEGSGAV